MKNAFGLFLVSLLLFNPSTQAQSIEAIKAQKSVLDSVLKLEMSKRQIPGMAYGIYKGDELALVGALGYADVQNRGVVTDSTVFELASITKQFTATAILMLQQEGKINVENSVCDYFEKCPASWQHIKIKNLLSHTSGLPGLYNDNGFNRTAYSGIDTMSIERRERNFGNWSKAFMADAVRGDQPESEPGERYNYSDVAFAVLGLIIDQMTGSYRTFIEQRIFKPLGMNSSYILDQQTVHANEARGYSLKNGKLINIMRFYDNEVPSHYGIFSNIMDLQKWDQALNGNMLLSEESKALAWSDFKLNNGEGIGYGFGWRIQDFAGKKIIFHSGITGTELRKFVDDDISVCILTNLGYNGNDRIAGGLTDIIAKVLDLNMFVNTNYLEHKGLSLVPISKQNLSGIVGTYTIMGDTISIDKQGDKLFINSPFGRYELRQLKSGGLIFLGASQEFILKPEDDSFNSFLINNRFKAKKIKS